ncbi:16S rRNA (adenine(1518)-N(6)/adenine(1519)-N(6))-dimethyltransferase RsmA [Adlercreutzia sp. ZJ154]|uniref:16S rRNA (adenine(1518)-N(6)/adenine(1519)-N(6))- dimethyltransferase RsmA n=1 Tax=Adlercreutzia sp. ZJ154 TaxID=2709790 RepID=UPI0013EDD04E|nr:16S rRNA (adenine(1518)-N(6)/adenine(1519)-N(6))-dimethyltransferase RsmA [Adlercreutzia sp. ZJ154]
MKSKVSSLASPSATTDVLRRFALSPKKQFGQNFLINDAIVRKILHLAEVCQSDDIIEIGPGIGTLTCALAANAHSVISVERDADLLDVLGYTMNDAKNFHLIMCDALNVKADAISDAVAHLSTFDTDCKLPSKLVANLPYAVAATVVLRFFEEFSFIKSATVMVQREVANRMQARPATKEYGAYTVKLSLFAKPNGSFSVSAGNFLPAPRVESTVIRLDRFSPKDESGKPFSANVITAAADMADAAFFARRKTIANSATAYFRANGASAIAQKVPEILEAAHIDPRRRGETLTQDEFLALGKIIALNVSEQGV